MLQNVPDSTGRYVGELLRRGDDNGFNIRGKASVSIRYRTFIVEIDHVSDAAHNVMDSQLAADVDGKAVIGHDFHTSHALASLAYYVETGFLAVEAAFVLIDTDSHNDIVEHGECTFEDIEMTRSERVEGARKKSSFIHVKADFSQR